MGFGRDEGHVGKIPAISLRIPGQDCVAANSGMSADQEIRQYPVTPATAFPVNAKCSTGGECGGPGKPLPPEFLLRQKFIKDRKNVVSGKSVSERVDLGGRGIIKKKKHTHCIT